MKITVRPSTQSVDSQSPTQNNEVQQISAITALDRCESSRQAAQSADGSPLLAGLEKPTCYVTVEPMSEEELKENAVEIARQEGVPPSVLDKVHELETLLGQASLQDVAQPRFSSAAVTRGEDALSKATTALARFNERRKEQDFGVPDLESVMDSLDGVWPAVMELGSVDAEPSAAVASLAQLMEVSELASFFDVPAEHRDAWLQAAQKLPVDAATRDAFVAAASEGRRLKVLNVTDGVPCVEATESDGEPLCLSPGTILTFDLKADDWLHGYHGGDRAMLRELFESL